MILVNANLLFYAYHPKAEPQEESRAWLEAMLSGPDLVRFAWPTLWAFLRIATNPRVFERPLSIYSASPAKSRGPSLPPQEPVIVGKHCNHLKFERAAPWVPASAGTARVEVADFSSRSEYLPNLSASPALRIDRGQTASLTRTYQEHTYLDSML